MSHKVVDLFSGCGGMSLGFKWAGFNTLLASDIDENCEKTFNANFSETPFICGDLADFQKKDFRPAANQLNECPWSTPADVIC